MRKERLTAVLFTLCIILVLALNIGVYYQLAYKNPLPVIENAEAMDTITPEGIVKSPVIWSYYHVIGRLFFMGI